MRYKLKERSMTFEGICFMNELLQWRYMVIERGMTFEKYID